MNPFTLLKEDHTKFKAMLSDLEATTDRAEKTRTHIFAELKHQLVAHEAVEEEIFYPAIRAKAKAKDEKLILEAYAEHHVADVVVEELTELPVTDEMWGAKAKVLQENLEHHIEEEEGDLFATARALLDKDELDEIGTRMDARRRELLGAVATA